MHSTVNYSKTGTKAAVEIAARQEEPFDIPLLADELGKLRDEIIEDPEIRVIILTGIERIIPPARRASDAASSVSLSQSIAGIDKPTIAAIGGDIIGPGLEAALACDIRISSDCAQFGLPQIREGRMPCDGGTQRLPRLVGRGMALEMILTGEPIDAREAFRIGLVNRIVSPEELMPTASRMADYIGSKAPVALKYVKEAVYHGLDMKIDQGLRLEADLYFLLHTTKDRPEGINAFREKREPHFKGE